MVLIYVHIATNGAVELLRHIASIRFFAIEDYNCGYAVSAIINNYVFRFSFYFKMLEILSSRVEFSSKCLKEKSRCLDGYCMHVKVLIYIFVCTE